MAVLLPVVDCYLYSFATELHINAMAHRNVLCVQNNQRFFLHLHWNVARSQVVDQVKHLVRNKAWLSILCQIGLLMLVNCFVAAF
jgi:hypothetical protein